MRLFYLLISVWLCAISCTPAPTVAPTSKLVLEQDGLRLTISPGHVPVETALTLTLQAEGLVQLLSSSTEDHRLTRMFRCFGGEAEVLEH